MKQTVKSIITVMIAVLMLTPTTTSTSSAQQSTESQTDTQFFQDFITDERIQNQQFREAFKDYQEAVDQLTLHNIGDNSSTGSTLEEVINSFTASVEPELFHLTEDESYLAYMYFSPDEAPAQAELLLYFVDEELYYIGLTNLQIDIVISEFVSDETMEDWIVEEIPQEALLNEDFRITGISEVLYNDTTYRMMMIPTVQADDGINIDYTIFEEDILFESYILDYIYSLEEPQYNMIQYFKFFTGISDEFPMVEEELIY